MKRKMVSQYVATGLAIAGVCLIAGCATTDTVTPRLPGLEANISAAKAADAMVYAPAQIKSAEAKLAAAKSALASKNMVAASRLVDEAMVDADYARVLAPTEKAKNDAGKLREEIESVRDQIKQMQTVK